MATHRGKLLKTSIDGINAINCTYRSYQLLDRLSPPKECNLVKFGGRSSGAWWPKASVVNSHWLCLLFRHIHFLRLEIHFERNCGPGGADWLRVLPFHCFSRIGAHQINIRPAELKPGPIDLWPSSVRESVDQSSSSVSWSSPIPSQSWQPPPKHRSGPPPNEFSNPKRIRC